jgi:flavin-dependent dehydrogenase
LLGTFRQPTWPYAVAQTAEFRSLRDADGEIEITVGLTDGIGTPIAGYGWAFPTGHGTVSLGVKLMSTSPSFQVINPVHLLDRFVDHQRERWQLDDGDAQQTFGGRVPMGGSVGPLAGPTYLIVGDAGGAANPLSGTGIETALETGSLGGTVVADALASDSPAALQQYPRLIELRYGSYYKVGRLAQRVLGQPTAARRIHRAVTSRRALADGTVRIALGHLRSRPGGGPELAYRLARAASTFAPDA